MSPDRETAAANGTANGAARGDANANAKVNTEATPEGLGVLFLPSTATEATSVGFLGAGLIAAGLVLLRKRRRT